MYAIDKWVDKNFLKKDGLGRKKLYTRSEINEIITRGYKDLFYSIKASNKLARSRQRDAYYENRHTDGGSY